MTTGKPVVKIANSMDFPGIGAVVKSLRKKAHNPLPEPAEANLAA